MARLEDVGEFALIARLTHGLSTRPDVALGVGDDAAALDLGADHLLLATCDAQVSGRHFLEEVATPREIGHKALAVNLSDVAAMGGEPLWALVSLIAPPDLDVAMIEGVYDGMRVLADRYHVAIVGGNISSTSGPLTLDITALGRVRRERMITRAGARPGDAVLVTGNLGAGLAGLRAVTAPPGVTLPTQALAEVRLRMTTPEPRVLEGQMLAATGMVTAMVDLSDGLAGDLAHICERSQVGALIDVAALPIAVATREIAAALGADAEHYALQGGDDYELLFTTAASDAPHVIAELAASGAIATVIGEITNSGLGMRLREKEGGTQPLIARGWDHLAPTDDV
ncbi:MAG TPA: thiamine-phosphate kinase [Ktedonobacterales bacterium]